MRTAVTEIRLATAADVPALVKLGWRFIASVPYGRLLGSNSDGLALALTRLLQSPGGVGFVALVDGEVRGTVLGTLTSPWTSPYVQVAAELAWWVDEELQGSGLGVRLLRQFEHWAEEKQVAGIVLSDLVRDEAPMLGELAARMGYRLVERSHLKERV